MATAVERQQAGAATMHTGVTPYIAVSDARRALEWYARALGARLRGEPIVMPDGRVGHAQFEIEGGLVMLSDAHPELGVVAPDPAGGASVTLHAEIGDVDALSARAVDAGATLERPPNDNPYGRIAVIRDPFGHRWMLNTPPHLRAATARRQQHGDLVYVSLWVADVERAADFYAPVLGWEYAPASPGRSRQVAGVSPSHGIFAGEPHGSLFICIGVDDIDAAVERVRAAGGQAGEPTAQPYGVVADCVDDQGVAFAVFALSGGAQPPGRPARDGEVGYVVLEVVDSARTRAFYGAVAGWRFRPGRIADGWQVEDVEPMVGISGGHQQATGVPMYRVGDIAAAVQRVRAAGGVATDPQPQPYGITAECSDDQGTRFVLGQI